MSQKQSLIDYYKKWGLAIAILMLAVGITFALKAQDRSNQQPPKSYTVTLTMDQWQNLINGMEGVKNRLKISDLPAKDVTYINDSLLATIQSEFVRQIQIQLQVENRPKDSTKTKKN